MAIGQVVTSHWNCLYAPCMTPAVMTPLYTLSADAPLLPFKSTHHNGTDERHRKDVADLKLEWRVDNVLVVGLSGRKAVEECAKSGKVMPSHIRHHENRT